jgi:hypothetical protein
MPHPPEDPGGEPRCSAIVAELVHLLRNEEVTLPDWRRFCSVIEARNESARAASLARLCDEVARVKDHPLQPCLAFLHINATNPLQGRDHVDLRNFMENRPGYPEGYFRRHHEAPAAVPRNISQVRSVMVTAIFKALGGCLQSERNLVEAVVDAPDSDAHKIAYRELYKVAENGHALHRFLVNFKVFNVMQRSEAADIRGFLKQREGCRPEDPAPDHVPPPPAAAAAGRRPEDPAPDHVPPPPAAGRRRREGGSTPSNDSASPAWKKYREGDVAPDSGAPPGTPENDTPSPKSRYRGPDNTDFTYIESRVFRLRDYSAGATAPSYPLPLRLYEKLASVATDAAVKHACKRAASGLACYLRTLSFCKSFNGLSTYDYRDAAVYVRIWLDDGRAVVSGCAYCCKYCPRNAPRYTEKDEPGAAPTTRCIHVGECDPKKLREVFLDTWTRLDVCIFCSANVSEQGCPHMDLLLDVCREEKEPADTSLTSVVRNVETWLRTDTGLSTAEAHKRVKRWLLDLCEAQ